MQQAQNHLHPQSARHPLQVKQALPGNKEKLYKNWLRVQASDLWRRELMFFKLPTQAPGRIPAYVQYNWKDPSICTIQHQRPRTSQPVQTSPLSKHTPRSLPRFDQTQSEGMAPVYPHSPISLGPESPTGVPTQVTQTLRILPPARGPRG
jgi:hypothetical protein